MKRDQVGGFFFAFVGILFFLLSIKLPVGKLTQPGPGIFPLGLSLLLFTAGIIIFFSTTKEKTKIDWRKTFSALAKPAAIVLLTLAYIILLSPLGYLITSFIYLFSLFLLVSRYKWYLSAGLSGILAVASWIFFGKILGIQFPLGPWNL
jgi:putative tricarboxylic transport membrane protein